MCLTPAQLEQVQDELPAILEATNPPDLLDRAEEYALQFAQGMGPVTPDGCATPGAVLMALVGRSEQVRDALGQLVRQTIRSAVRWIGSRVCHLSGLDLQEWADSETPAVGIQLFNALLLGCTCSESWEHLRIATQEAAQDRCQAEHCLICWGGTVPLQRFLFRALVHGALRLPDAVSGDPECALTNGFRHGMLAKAIAYQHLWAGPVLRCNHAPCQGDICLTDTCVECSQVSGVRNPSWWLWLNGERTPWRCRRCLPGAGGCDCLYFQNPGQCPRCQAQAWSRGPTEVWIPVGWFAVVSAVDNDSPAVGFLPEDEDTVAPPTEVLVLEQVEQLLNDPANHFTPEQRIVLEGFLLDGLERDEVAAQVGMPPDSPVFGDLVEAAFANLPTDLIAAC